MKVQRRNIVPVVLSLIVVGMISISTLGLGSIMTGSADADQFNSTPRISGMDVDAVEPANAPPVAVIGDLQTGFIGEYYNLPADHPDVEGDITGIVAGDTPFNHDWWDSQYFAFERNDLDLTFGSDFFPVDEGLPGDPQYFSVHWYANITVPEDDSYEFLMGSDDDSWLYIDDGLVIDLGGVHALAEDTGFVNLTAGTHQLDIYFAERHLVQSGFYFEFVDERVLVETTIFWDDIYTEIGEPVEFKGSSSYDLDGTIAAYDWDFGDGQTGTGAKPEHAYSNSGEFAVTLTVTDDDGATDTDTCLVVVANAPPVADAGIDQSVIEGATVYFDGTGSYDVGGNPESYDWDFGDGETGTGQYQNHVYAVEGVYTVTLTVIDNEGASDSDTSIITVFYFEEEEEEEIPEEPEDPIEEPEDPIEDPVEPDPIVVPEADLSYTIIYYNEVGETIVDEVGIHFSTSGEGDYRTVEYYDGFLLPEEDYGVYPMYTSSSPVYFKIIIENIGTQAFEDMMVTSIQEFHNDMIIWDAIGEYRYFEGQQKEGDAVETWTLDSLDGGESMTFFGIYDIEGRGWGLDQTHLKVWLGDVLVVNDPDAGVYCPPP